MKNVLCFCVVALVLTACGSDDKIVPRADGEACEIDEGCEGEVCLLELSDPNSDNSIVFPDGMCTNECDLEDDASCVEEDICLRYRPTGEQYCFPECGAEDAENPDTGACRDGYNCLCLDDPILCFLGVGRAYACVPSTPVPAFVPGNTLFEF